MNVLLDLGFHQGGFLRTARKRWGVDESWLVHAFEPNPACHRFFPRDAPANWHFHPHAIWVSDGVVPFRQENWAVSGSGSPVVDPANRNDGWGSTCVSDSFHAGLGEPFEVLCVDFSKFLDRLGKLPDLERCICKMDIEGAEFPVIEKLLKDETIGTITELHVEWHARLLPDTHATAETVQRLSALIRRADVRLIRHQ